MHDVQGQFVTISCLVWHLPCTLLQVMLQGSQCVKEFSNLDLKWILVASYITVL